MYSIHAEHTSTTYTHTHTGGRRGLSSARWWLIYSWSGSSTRSTHPQQTGLSLLGTILSFLVVNMAILQSSCSRLGWTMSLHTFFVCICIWHCLFWWGVFVVITCGLLNHVDFYAHMRGHEAVIHACKQDYQEQIIYKVHAQTHTWYTYMHTYIHTYTCARTGETTVGEIRCGCLFGRAWPYFATPAQVCMCGFFMCVVCMCGFHTSLSCFLWFEDLSLCTQVSYTYSLFDIVLNHVMSFWCHLGWHTIVSSVTKVTMPAFMVYFTSSDLKLCECTLARKIPTTKNEKTFFSKFSLQANLILLFPRSNGIDYLVSGSGALNGIYHPIPQSVFGTTQCGFMTHRWVVCVMYMQ